MWITSWYALEVMLKSHCCGDMLYESCEFMDKCCCLQAGLIMTGVALLYKRIVPSVCLPVPFLHTFSPCATSLAVERSSLGSLESGRKKCLSFLKSALREADSGTPRHLMELTVSKCHTSPLTSSTTLRQRLSGPEQRSPLLMPTPETQSSYGSGERATDVCAGDCHSERL